MIGFETRELKVFDAKAWFRRTPRETLIKTVLAWSARSIDAIPRPDFGRGLARPSSGFRWRRARRPSSGTNGFARIGASRTAAITCATPPLLKTRRASTRTPTSSRACAPSLIICSASSAAKTSKTPAARCPRYQPAPRNIGVVLRTKQPPGPSAINPYS